MQLLSELQTPPRRPVQVVGHSATPALRENGGPACHPDPTLAAAPSTGDERFCAAGIVGLSHQDSAGRRDAPSRLGPKAASSARPSVHWFRVLPALHTAGSKPGLVISAYTEGERCTAALLGPLSQRPSGCLLGSSPRLSGWCPG